MSNETKRDVLKKALDFFVMYGIEQSINYDLERYQYLSEYDDALPDDLPVIPKAVGEYTREAKFEDVTLLEAMGCARDPVFKNFGRWITSHSEYFARAWLLGVWRVEETGEIVKLEAEVRDE